MTGVPRPAIRTPDQRLRVFVSSTLRELADERRAARAAIERMRLAPVMFELGARPHPPRELYRAYLHQSDVFVGIYGESYGWIAPDEEISGLEDEYDLAPADMPKLIYIKAAAHRDERLTRLIARIQADDQAAYLHFDTAAELEERLTGDLATLLAERFDASQSVSGGARQQAGEDAIGDAGGSLAGRIPAPYTKTIGREHDVHAVRQLLAVGADRLVSLIGAGGIGKSRLAIEVARASADLFPDGICFVLLEGVLEPGLLLPTIAYALGVRDNGTAGLEDRIAQALAGRRMLLVLDNFEQIVDAAPVLVRLYTAAPTVTFLVTSRVVLRIRGEHVYDVGALPPPDGAEPASLLRAVRSSAVELFVDRAQAVKPGFALTEDNAADIADICRRLEGLPLGIELAAAKVRALTPAAIAQRLEHSLPLLTGASRDLPERHRTMTAAIEWSVSLLPDVQREMLEDLGVFATRFSLEAVESLGAGRSWDGLGVDGLADLIDASLVKQTEVWGRATFSLLSIVREYALGRLKARGEAATMRSAHADYYMELVRRTAPDLRGAGQIDAVRQLDMELPNLRAAARHLVYTDRLDEGGDFAWRMLVYWWISGFLSEVRLWMLELLGKEQPISTRTRAIALFLTMWGEMWQRPSDQVVAGLGEAVGLFTEAGDADASAMALAARGTARMQFPDLDVAVAESELREATEALRALGNWWAEAMAAVGLGLLAMVRGAMDEAVAHFGRGIAISDARHDIFLRVVLGNNAARLAFFAGDTEAAEREFRVTLAYAARLHYDEGAAYGLEGICAVAAARGEAWAGGALSAVAESVRRRIGVFDVEGFSVHVRPLQALRDTDPGAVAAGERAAADMTVGEAIAIALPDAEASIRQALAQW